MVKKLSLHYDLNKDGTSERGRWWIENLMITLAHCDDKNLVKNNKEWWFLFPAFTEINSLLNLHKKFYCMHAAKKFLSNYFQTYFSILSSPLQIFIIHSKKITALLCRRKSNKFKLHFTSNICNKLGKLVLWEEILAHCR